jgi:hypothetical protein
MQLPREACYSQSQSRSELAATEIRDRQTKQDCLLGIKREHSESAGLDLWPTRKPDLPSTTQVAPRAMDRAGIVRRQGTSARCRATVESIYNQADGRSVVGQERSQLPETSGSVRDVWKAQRWRYIGRALLPIPVYGTIHPLGRLRS